MASFSLWPFNHSIASLKSEEDANETIVELLLKKIRKNAISFNSSGEKVNVQNCTSFENFIKYQNNNVSLIFICYEHFAAQKSHRNSFEAMKNLFWYHFFSLCKYFSRKMRINSDVDAIKDADFQQKNDVWMNRLKNGAFWPKKGEKSQRMKCVQKLITNSCWNEWRDEFILRDFFSRRINLHLKFRRK